jgi:hypothetical protein
MHDILDMTKGVKQNKSRVILSFERSVPLEGKHSVEGTNACPENMIPSLRQKADWWTNISPLQSRTNRVEVQWTRLS